MTRRIVRSAFQLGVLLAIIILTIFILDNRFGVLPQSVHSHLPIHHPGLIITDITVTTCSTINPFSGCKLDPDEWHRIEKDLYLHTGWTSSAWVHIKRKREEELKETDRVVLDIRIGTLDPMVGEKEQKDERWEARAAGIWLKRSARKHASDSKHAITAVDVLFGADAVEPRPGWEIKDRALLLDTHGEVQEARLSVRRGPPSKIEKPVPKIRTDGRFKIMQISDLHLSTGTGHCRDAMPEGHNGGRCEADTRTAEFVGKVLDDEKPDMVVLSGDQVNGETAPDAQSAIFKWANLLIERQIPYAAIFGNHDDEGSLSRSLSMSLMEAGSLPYSLSQPGPNTIDGVGNYYVEVVHHKDTKHSALTLYFLDSHGYSPDEAQFKGYDWIKPNQITWFKDTATRLKQDHKKASHIHLDMAFIHIPLPEYRDALGSGDELVGTAAEPPTAPGFNSHFKDALVEQGVMAVSCGHDHVNDYCALSKGVDKRPELWMCYAGGSGFGGYGGYKEQTGGGYHRRIRMFEVDINTARITTWKRLEYGKTEEKLDLQTIVDGGKVVSAQ